MVLDHVCGSPTREEQEGEEERKRGSKLIHLFQLIFHSLFGLNTNKLSGEDDPVQRRRRGKNWGGREKRWKKKLERERRGKEKGERGGYKIISY